MAQTYLYWDHDRLYQMNVSYLSSIDRWVNSPGFVDGDAAYARPIGPRCLECHSTFARQRARRNQFDPSSLILGVSCERCHGPGKKHVDYHKLHPDASIAMHIANPSLLNRRQQLDICGQCHTGVTPFKTRPYHFRPGDRLEEHYQTSKNGGGGSVHTSNQLARLSESQCFIESEMTCTDCHNPHLQERGETKLFSERCLACHQPQECGMHDRLGIELEENCIDCHMPNRQTKNLWMKTTNTVVFPELRDHYIRVDRMATDAFLQTRTNK